MLKAACSGFGESRTRNLSVTSAVLYHYTTAPTNVASENRSSTEEKVPSHTWAGTNPQHLKKNSKQQ